MDVLVGAWWFGEFMNIYVGRLCGVCLDTCMDVSVCGWWLSGCVNECVGRFVVVGMIHGSMIR